MQRLRGRGRSRSFPLNRFETTPSYRKRGVRRRRAASFQPSTWVWCENRMACINRVSLPYSLPPYHEPFGSCLAPHLRCGVSRLRRVMFRRLRWRNIGLTLLCEEGQRSYAGLSRAGRLKPPLRVSKRFPRGRGALCRCDVGFCGKSRWQRLKEAWRG